MPSYCLRTWYIIQSKCENGFHNVPNVMFIHLTVLFRSYDPTAITVLFGFISRDNDQEPRARALA